MVQVHAQLAPFYAGKPVWVAENGNHYHVAGCAMIDHHWGPYHELTHDAALANIRGRLYQPCLCAFRRYRAIMRRDYE